MEDRVQQRGDDQHGAASAAAASSGRRQGRQSLLLQPELPQNHPEAAGLCSRLRTLPILVQEDHLGNITFSMPLIYFRMNICPTDRQLRIRYLFHTYAQ